MNRKARFGIIAVGGDFCYAGSVTSWTHSDDKAYKSLTVSRSAAKDSGRLRDEPNMHLVTAGSLHGLLESLDPESSYLTPREYTEYSRSSRMPDRRDRSDAEQTFGYVIVISVLPDSQRKGRIHSGDIFESVAGFTRGLSVDKR